MVMMFKKRGIAPGSCSSQPDSISWTAGPSSSFTVPSAYNLWESSLGHALSCTNILWNNCAPPKVQFFEWLAWHGKIKTASFLCRIGVLGSNVNQACIFCNNEVESVNHILLSCPFVWLIWSNIVRWWGLQWVLPGSVPDLLHWWSGCRMKELEKKIWLAIPLAVLWSIWKLRNKCVFNGSHPNQEVLCDLIKVRIALWVKASSPSLVFSVSDLVSNLQQVLFCLRHGG